MTDVDDLLLLLCRGEKLMQFFFNLRFLYEIFDIRINSKVTKIKKENFLE